MIKYNSLPIYGKVIYLTVCIFLLTQLWQLGCVLFVVNGYDWRQLLALPAHLPSLLMRPWTLFTYMFCHADLSQNLFHILFNMVWLWWFGQTFMRFHTQRQFLCLYLLGGLVAGLFFVGVYNLFPYFIYERRTNVLVGASGALMALMGAVAMQPDQRVGVNLIFRTVTTSMQRLTFIIMALVLFAGSDSSNTGGMVCHVGGALFGLLYGSRLRQGQDITAWVWRWADAIQGWVRRLGRPRMKVTVNPHHSHVGTEKQRDMDYNAERRQREAEIDRILDKISKHGYDGLTAEEKQLLFDASKRRNH